MPPSYNEMKAQYAHAKKGRVVNGIIALICFSTAYVAITFPFTAPLAVMAGGCWVLGMINMWKFVRFYFLCKDLKKYFPK
jgi:hypothetical protein